MIMRLDSFDGGIEKSLLDENSLSRTTDVAFDLEENHFDKDDDPHREQPEKFDPQMEIRVLLFAKVKENKDQKWREKLKKRLELETENFFKEHNITDKVGLK
jgi:hypothetical protein